MDARDPSAFPLVPPRLARFARRRLAEALGAALIALALALALALASHDGADPSFNTATAAAPGNLLGVPGAVASDLLIQAIGLSAWLIGALALAWGWRLTSHGGFGRAWLRLGAAPLGLIAAATALAAVDRGGVVGTLVFPAAAGLVAPWTAAPAIAVASCAGILAVAAMIAGMGLSVGEWRAAGAGAWTGARRVARLIRPLIRPLVPTPGRSRPRLDRPERARVRPPPTRWVTPCLRPSPRPSSWFGGSRWA